MSWFFSQISAFIGKVLAKIDSLIPSVPSGIDSFFNTTVSWLSPFLYWVPFAYVLMGLSIVFSAVVAGFVIRLVRIAASFATLGGGA